MQKVLGTIPLRILEVIHQSKQSKFSDEAALTAPVSNSTAPITCPHKSCPRQSLRYIERIQILRILLLTMAGLFGSSSSTTAQASNTLGDLSKDVLLENPPEDSISDVSFSSQSDHLAVASWDNKVRIYEITPDGKSQPRAMFEHEGPVLSCHWSKVSCKSSKFLKE